MRVIVPHLQCCVTNLTHGASVTGGLSHLTRRAVVSQSLVCAATFVIYCDATDYALIDEKTSAVP